MKHRTHDWSFACVTPQGGAAGGDDIYVCLSCGRETNNVVLERQLSGPCMGTGKACPGCKLKHPEHTGPCPYRCGCRVLSKQRTLGQVQ